MPDQVRTILLYAQDRKGLGHINRTLTIARHLLAADATAIALIVTKSPVPSLFSVPERCDFIKLPVRLTPAGLARTEQDEEAARQRYHALDRQILRDVALGLEPELVLVDHEPLGFKGDFREGLYALKERVPGARIVFGMRDIMDDPARIQAEWRAAGAYEAMERLFDGIAVYGSERVYDVAEAYALPEGARAKLRYCGYIVRERAASDARAVRARYELPAEGPLVLGAVGSGSDGYPVLAAARAALDRARARRPDLAAILVTGPFMPDAEREALLAGASAWCRVVRQADTFALMAAADAAITMGGYNSVGEALAVACPPVIVPRATHKIEQLIRAETLAARNLARCVPPSMLSADRLADGIEWALGQDRAAFAARVGALIPTFDGAAALVTYLSPWLGPDGDTGADG